MNEVENLRAENAALRAEVKRLSLAIGEAEEHERALRHRHDMEAADLKKEMGKLYHREIVRETWDDFERERRETRADRVGFGLW